VVFDFGQYPANAMKFGLADPAPIHRDAGGREA